MVLSLRASSTPDPIFVLEKFLEKFSASMKIWTDQFVESMKQARPNANLKPDRRVLICGAIQEEDCLCVVVESMELELYELCDAVTDFEVEEENGYQNQLKNQQDDDSIVTEEGDHEALLAKLKDPSPPIPQACEQLVHDKVTTFPYTDLADPSLFANTGIGRFCAIKKELIIATEGFDIMLERREYIPTLNPDPPDDCTTPSDKSIAGLYTSVSLEGNTVAAFDYADALYKSLLFFEAQKSGKLPTDQRIKWRGDSGLSDSFKQGVDLVRGYYDACDHVKFGLPMAHNVTMLSWGVIEFRKEIIGLNQMVHALAAIKWGTDYLIKAHTQPNVLWAVKQFSGELDGHCLEWDEDHTIHFVGHSTSVQVVCVLQQMLADKAFKGHENTYENWVLSLTSLSGALTLRLLLWYNVIFFGIYVKHSSSCEKNHNFVSRGQRRKAGEEL